MKKSELKSIIKEEMRSELVKHKEILKVERELKALRIGLSKALNNMSKNL